MKSLLDPTFHYVPSCNTDIRKTFARVRREAQRSDGAEPGERAATNVVVLPRERKAATP